MLKGSRYGIFWIMLLFKVFTARATGTEGTQRYYDPLDRLAGNPTLLSRNKEAPTDAVVRFPFSDDDYAARMAKLAGCYWDPLSSQHLGKLTGPYAEKMYDALGVYAELHAPFSQEFKSRKVSENYQLLAPMLSGMNVHYVSEGGKRGVWQLDIITAVRYGLSVTDTRDDRDDPVLAARAAAAYLSDLQDQFRSPEAVLWAYISSPAEVRRAFGRAESSDPKKAMAFLPDYVKPAVAIFSAWAFIWNYTDRDNLPVFTPAFFLPYENALTADRTHLGQISEMLEIPLASLRELNPSLKKETAGAKETVHLPPGYASRFLLVAPLVAKYKDTLYFRPEPLVKPAATATGTAPQPAALNTTVKKYHKVKSGETLGQIAGKYHVSVSSLKKWNHLSSSHIRAGQKIVVQVTVQNAVSTKEDQSIRENVKIEGGSLTTEEKQEEITPVPVHSGENTTVETAVKPPVPQRTSEGSKPKPTSAWIYYTVRSGDTLSSIGRKYGVPYSRIKEWNGLRSDSLRVGQKLKIKK